jgi:hypothetical protein
MGGRVSRAYFAGGRECNGFLRKSGGMAVWVCAIPSFSRLRMRESAERMGQREFVLWSGQKAGLPAPLKGASLEMTQLREVSERQEQPQIPFDFAPARRSFAPGRLSALASARGREQRPVVRMTRGVLWRLRRE